VVVVFLVLAAVEPTEPEPGRVVSVDTAPI
jgi:hypothetical protein